MGAQVNWLLDSNILIDYLNGVHEAANVLAESEATCISRVSWIEVLVGAADPEQMQALRAWLSRFRVVEVEESVAERAIDLRRRYRMRLPDALIWASAQVHGLILISRNIRDFPASEPGIHVPYAIESG
jgi:predicted nucleic acid-binding protein